MSVQVLAVDPGVSCCGWAAFDCETELVACDLARGEPAEMVDELSRFAAGHTPSVVVIELPQVYLQRRWKGDPNDLIRLAVVVGRIRQALSFVVEPELVRPHAWKGSRPKRICHALTRSLLSTEERLVLDGCGVPVSLKHNVVDAVGIGLWRCGRRP